MAKSLTNDQLDELRLGQGSFGSAIAAAKEGYKVARTGWNGAGMFAYIVPSASYPSQTGVAKQHFGEMLADSTELSESGYWAVGSDEGTRGEGAKYAGMKNFAELADLLRQGLEG